jgi:hypothetical protein
VKDVGAGVIYADMYRKEERMLGYKDIISRKLFPLIIAVA